MPPESRWPRRAAALGIAVVIVALAALGTTVVHGISAAPGPHQTGLRLALCVPHVTTEAVLGSNSSTPVASFGVTLTVGAGDMITVWSFLPLGAQHVTGVADSQFNFYGKVEVVTTGDGVNTELWNATAASSGSETISVTPSASTQYWDVIAEDVACAGKATPLGNATDSSGSVTKLAVPFSGPVVGDVLLAGLGWNNHGGPPSPLANNLAWPERSAISTTVGSQQLEVANSTAGNTSASTIYWNGVGASNPYDIGGAVVEIAQGTSAHAPAAPTAVTAATLSTTSINVAWTNPGGGGLTDNHVYTWTDAFTCAGPPGRVADLGGVFVAYAVPSLTQNGVYSFAVTANNSTGESPHSACVTNDTIPNAPTGLTAASTSSTSIHLAWTNPADPDSQLFESGVKEYAGGSCAGSPISQSTFGVSTSYSATGLTPLTTYSFKVNVSNSLNVVLWSALSVCANATSQGPPIVVAPYVFGHTGFLGSPIPWVHETVHIWENATGGTLPFNYTWTVVKNGSSEATIDTLAWFNSGETGTSNENNVTFNATGNYTLVVNITDVTNATGHAWISAVFGPPNPILVQTEAALTFGLYGLGVWPGNGSNVSYGGNFTIHPFLSEVGAIEPLGCVAAGWTLYKATDLVHAFAGPYGVNQTLCLSNPRSLPLMDPVVGVNVPLGVYVIVGWANDTDTGNNHTVHYQFTVLAAPVPHGGAVVVPANWTGLLIGLAIILLLAFVFALAIYSRLD